MSYMESNYSRFEIWGSLMSSGGNMHDEAHWWSQLFWRSLKMMPRWTKCWGWSRVTEKVICSCAAFDECSVLQWFASQISQHSHPEERYWYLQTFGGWGWVVCPLFFALAIIGQGCLVTIHNFWLPPGPPCLHWYAAWAALRQQPNIENFTPLIKQWSRHMTMRKKDSSAYSLFSISAQMYYKYVQVNK